MAASWCDQMTEILPPWSQQPEQSTSSQQRDCLGCCCSLSIPSNPSRAVQQTSRSHCLQILAGRPSSIKILFNSLQERRRLLAEDTGAIQFEPESCRGSRAQVPPRVRCPHRGTHMVQVSSGALTPHCLTSTGLFFNPCPEFLLRLWLLHRTHRLKRNFVSTSFVIAKGSHHIAHFL